MRLRKMIPALALVGWLGAECVAGDAVAEIRKLPDRAAEFRDRDRKGEPLDVIADRAAGEKSRSLRTPTVTAAAATVNSANPGNSAPSRLDLWKQHRQRQQQASPATGADVSAASGSDRK